MFDELRFDGSSWRVRAGFLVVGGIVMAFAVPPAGIGIAIACIGAGRLLIY
jgi:hypothetical protein